MTQTDSLKQGSCVPMKNRFVNHLNLDSIRKAKIGIFRAKDLSDTLNLIKQIGAQTEAWKSLHLAVSPSGRSP